MFVRVKVGIEKKNYLLTTKIRVFPELKHTQSIFVGIGRFQRGGILPRGDFKTHHLKTDKKQRALLCGRVFLQWKTS